MRPHCDDVAASWVCSRNLSRRYSAPEKDRLREISSALPRTQKLHLGNAQAGSRPGRRRKERFMSQRLKVRLLSLLVLLVVWEFYGRRVNPILFTYPTAILRAFIGLVTSGELQSYMQESLLVLFYASILSGIGGVLLGVVMARFSLVEGATVMYVGALDSMLVVAMGPRHFL